MSRPITTSLHKESVMTLRLLQRVAPSRAVIAARPAIAARQRATGRDGLRHRREMERDLAGVYSLQLGSREIRCHAFSISQDSPMLQVSL